MRLLLKKVHFLKAKIFINKQITLIIKPKNSSNNKITLQIFMLYYLFQYINEFYNIPGAGVFQYISFRSGMAVITSLILSLLYGKRIINLLQKNQIGEVVRDLDLEGQYKKKGTPTMGGIIILLSIVIPTLLFAKLENIYVLLMLITTVWLGMVGFVDDYIKVIKKNKAGLAGKYKILAQVSLALIVGLILHYHNDVIISTKILVKDSITKQEVREIAGANENAKVEVSIYQHSLIRKKINSDTLVHNDILASIGESSNQTVYATVDLQNSTKTSIPFMKNNEFDYMYLTGFMDEYAKKWGWLVFVLAVIVITTAVSNGANMTDGLDGLATGVSAIIGVTLGILAYLSGNVVFADYLNIMYIPNSGELVVYMSAFIGATIGFLYYNSYPAQVFMGDTGSLALGGIIAVFAIVIRKELLIPILCGIFLVENLSVMLQVSYFKYTRKKYGEGRRIFKMAPLHHHYQKLGYTEPKIVSRFWIVGIVLAVITLITLKLR